MQKNRSLDEVLSPPVDSQIEIRIADPSPLPSRFVSLLRDDARRRMQETVSTASRVVDQYADHGIHSPVSDHRILSVDTAACAVLLAAGLDSDPRIMNSLTEGHGIVVVPAEGLSETVSHVLEVCVFGRDTTILDGSELSRSGYVAGGSAARSAVVLTCNVTRSSEIERLRERAVRALSFGLPVCALSHDPSRLVPELIRKHADFVLAPGRWNGGLLETFVEAVTGTRPEVADAPWMGSIRLDDLRISVSHRRGAAASVQRLQAIVERRTAASDDLPHLSDLSGYGRAKTAGLAIIKDLEDYRAGRISWQDVERGMLLEGPPGVGKSLFARVLAKSASLPLVVASLAEWQSSGGGYLGDCLKAMKGSFSEAKAAAPAVLFIDELDSIGDRASFDSRHRDYSSQVLNCLLQELDGAAGRDGVFVIGATNFLDRIDPAIVRPGRIDRIVRIDLPEVRDLVGIFRTCLGQDLPDVELMPAALAARGGSGADVASWVRRARGTARRARRPLCIEYILDAVREDRASLPEAFRRRAAVHEAGHACAAVALGIGEVDSISLHAAGGRAFIRPTDEALTRDRAVRDIVMLLAGRAAEIVFTGCPSAGSGGPDTSDLARATRTAMAVEAAWGLGTAGPVWLGDPEETSLPMAFGAVIAPGMHLLRHAEREAELLIRANRTTIDRLASRLMEVGHVDADEIASIVGNVPPFKPANVPLPIAGEGADRPSGSAAA